jgi:ubiquinone biosynthesis accessory factor UbiK
MATFNNFLDDLAARLSEALAASPAKDIEKNTRAMLASFFSRLDLVTREEFDVQVQLLERARERILKLEARLTALEREQQPPRGTPSPDA